MKKATLVVAVLLGGTLGFAHPGRAQAPRLDVTWARTTAGAPLALDGVLDEAAWAKAESVLVQYPNDNGIPGSGWKDEGGFPATDRTRAVFKFLVVGNDLWIGATMRDSSIGGSDQFNRFDGLLMGLKDHGNAYRPAPPGEHFISWWWPPESGDPNPGAPGKQPSMIGRWRTWPPGTPPTAEQLTAWDARIKVHGLSNSDAAADTGYTIEMRFGLTQSGYDVTTPQGDIIEWNCSVYDLDWFWPLSNFFRLAVNRSWIQGPWGNDSWYHNLHVYSRPSVTINSGAVPTVAPEIRIPNAGGYPSPAIDGQLTEAVWGMAPHFDIRYDDAALRSSYPGVGPFRSGQYQAPVNGNGGLGFVADPADATIKYFFKADTLYLGFDVRDQVVQYHANSDRWDGASISLNDPVARGPDHNLKGYRITFQVGPTGQLLAQDYLPFLRDTAGGARAQLHLNPGTTVDTLGLNTDNGYTAELAFDLTKLGYPHGLGTGALYLGIDLLDGDSYVPFTDSYGTRTWFFRENEGRDGACIGYLDPNLFLTTGVGDPPRAATSFALLGNFPNPFKRGTTIRYSLPEASVVELEVFDVLGRSVATRALGVQPPGSREVRLPSFASGSGVYLYRMRFSDAVSGARKATLSGKMMVLQ